MTISFFDVLYLLKIMITIIVIIITATTKNGNNNNNNSNNFDDDDDNNNNNNNNLARIFCDDIGMEFGIDKCATLVLKRWKITKFDGISLSDAQVMKRLVEGAGYKCLGIIQADQIRCTEMTEKDRTEYLRRVRKASETTLNGGNIIKEINICAISLLRYSAAFIDLNCTELTQLDRRTRKLMTMHNALHPKSNVHGLNIRKKEGGRGLQGVEETVQMTNLG